MVIEAYTKLLVITVESSNISYQMRKVNIITKNLLMLQGPGFQENMAINQSTSWKTKEDNEALFIIDN